MGIVESVALGLGAAWAGGINLYATMVILGVLDLIGVVSLPEHMAVLSSPAVLITALIFYVFEFFVDKIPGADSVWDMIHTFIRIPAGALMAIGMTESLEFGIDPQIQFALALAGGGILSAGAHMAKTGARVMINTSPEPVTNLLASFFEDALVAVGLLLAVFLPIVFFVFFGLMLMVAFWLIPKIWRGILGFARRFRHPVATLRQQKDDPFTLTMRR